MTPKTGERYTRRRGSVSRRSWKRRPGATASLFLGGILARHPVSQAFVFHGDGEPFWAARVPPTRDELAALNEAITFIDRLEGSRPTPFIGHDPSWRFTVAALEDDSNLYIVCIGLGADPLAAEERVAIIRAELLPDDVAGVRPTLRLVR